MTHFEACTMLAGLARQWIENFEQTIPDLEEVGPNTTDAALQAIVTENADLLTLEEAETFRSARRALQAL